MGKETGGIGSMRRKGREVDKKRTKSSLFYSSVSITLL
jgi:hypothetical protein